MPRINRIRIANVPYSGRYIVDQLIDCYNGENVLLNLSNGGGKSVLTQLIMQPIIPNVKIHKRKVESYLTSKEPTFVMLEWILDNTATPTYFLTGIVMNRAITEENKYRIKYFTFVNQYKSANHFDIMNIDFITKQDGVTRYKSYDYCLSELRKREGISHDIETFTIDEQKRYSQVLEERGIFKDEWKILAKMNEKEGGADDLFEKCEKADDVVNQWILKTISENLENAEDLREMFLNLMEEVISNEDKIKQKEELEKFKEEADKYSGKLANLLENMDKQEIIRKELEEIYLKLSVCLNNSKKKQSEFLEKIKETNAEIGMIKYEEVSDEYYKLENNLEASLKKLEEKRKEIEEQDKKQKEIVENLRIVKAAKIYGEYKEARAEKEAAFASKEKLQKGEQREKIRNIEYSLKTEYEKQISILKDVIENLKKELEDINKVYKAAKSEEELESKKYTDMQRKSAVILDREENFKNYEKEIFESLQLELVRNILEELDEKEVKEIDNGYEKINTNLVLQIEDNGKELKISDDKIKSNIEEIEDISKKIEKLIEKAQSKKQEIENYEKQTYELKKILEYFAIDRQRLFDMEINLSEIERQKDFVRNRKNEDIEKLNQNKEILYSLRNGGIHVDLKIGKILEKNKIEYETGEDYLTGQERAYRQKLLQINPILPYSYIILNEKDYEKIEELIAGEEISRLTPIILQKDIERDFKPKNKSVSLIDNLKLECLYNVKAFDDDLRKEFELSLIEEIEALEANIREEEEKLDYIKTSIKFIKEYSYDENTESKLTNELKEIEEQKDNLELRKGEINKENDRLNEIKDNINKNIYEINKKIEYNQKDREKFAEYLNKNKDYMELLKEKQKIKKVTEENEKKREELKQKIEECKNETDRLNQKVRENEDNKIKLEEKSGKIPNVENGEKLNQTLEVLEKIYEELKSDILKDEASIEENIKKANKIMNLKERELTRDYQDLKGKYEEKIYSEEEEDFAREKQKEIEKELNYLREEEKKVNNEKIRFETKLEGVNESLTKLEKPEPLQAHLIKGNYDNRRKELKERTRDIETKLNDLSKNIDKINESIYIVIGVIKDKPKYREIDISGFDYNNTKIDELAKELDNKNNENAAKKTNINNLYKEIEANNKEKDPVIRNFLTNMDPQRYEFADYYFIYERVTDCAKKLEEMIKVLKTTMEHMENDKDNIKHHAYVQGKYIYLEMKNISDSSDIKMEGRLRKVQLLEIDIPKELDQFAKERMNDYIENCINRLREECKEQEENSRQVVAKRIKDWLSDRQLLNVVINTENIGVRLYKFDISEKNSGLKKWEDVISENSGGEKLASCIILVLALIQYTRKKVLAKYGDDGKLETSKFLVLDNPFGKMSSKHLLDGLMMVLNKFNAQAICLSDISQSSVTNKFNVIYQLSLKSGKYTDKIYLTEDKVIKNPELVQNYLLEQSFLKADAQLVLWE